MKQGHIPVELLELTATPRIAYPGRPKLTFPPSSEAGGRRVEWLDSEVEVRNLLDQFNKPGRPPIFVIANDLILNHAAAERRRNLAADLESLLGPQLDALCAALKIERLPLLLPAVTPVTDVTEVAEVAASVEDVEAPPVAEAELDLTPPGARRVGGRRK